MMRETPVVVYPSSGLPILESIGLFRSARAVVGPHGAGFSNLILAPDDAVVVEIRPAASMLGVEPAQRAAAGPVRLYERLATTLGLRYVAFGAPFRWNDTELTADPRGFAAAVARALETPPEPPSLYLVPPLRRRVRSQPF